MRLKEPDVQKERLLGRLLQEPRCCWSNLGNMISRGLDNFVVTNYRGILGDVLDAYESGAISMRPQCVQNVLLVIVQGKAAVRQPEHAIVVGTMPGQKAGAAGRARRRGAEWMPEQDPFAGKLLQVRRRDIESVGLNVPAGIVRMDVENIELAGFVRRLGAIRYQSGPRY